MHSKSVLFLCPYPYDEAPSQRFRFEQYLNLLKKRNIKISQAPFLSTKAWSIFYKDGKTLLKICYIALGSVKRLLLLFSLPFYKYIFIHREAFPMGPPVYEWIVAKLFRKKIIYDFDDAIWLEDPNEQGTLKSKLKYKEKVSSICKWSYKISTGNEYLASYAKRFNDNVVINPTTIDTTNVHNPKNFLPLQQPRRPVIGWTGTHSTLHYLKEIIPVIKELEEELDFELLIIANKKPNFQLKSLRFTPWRKHTEIEDLMRIDFGLMPLTDDKWSLGKCGFKALQYMALEKPALVSPVGVNEKIVEDQKTGFLCETKEDWKNNITILIKNRQLALQMGADARQFVEKNYSTRSNSSTFLSLFEIT